MLNSSCPFALSAGSYLWNAKTFPDPVHKCGRLGMTNALDIGGETLFPHLATCLEIG
jgi:hypothetical protein